jgi:hypothetical protein
VVDLLFRGPTVLAQGVAVVDVAIGQSQRRTKIAGKVDE